MSDLILHISAAWAAWMWGQFWQVGLLIGLVAVADRCLRNWAWPQVRLALWSLIPLKLILPPGLVLPTSVSSDWFDEQSVPFLYTASVERLGLTGWLSPTFNASEFQNASVSAILATGWLAGVVTIALAYRSRFRQLQAALNQDANQLPCPAWLGPIVVSAAREVGLRTLPPLFVTRRVATPAVFGLIRPRILLPPAALSNMSAADVRFMLIHEFAHVRRRDLWLQALWLGLHVAYWFNPLLYVIRGRIYQLRELCCDATVAERLREQTRDYRETLLRAARTLLSEAPIRMPALSLLGGANDLLERVRALTRPTYASLPVRRLAAVATTFAAAAFVLPMGRTVSPHLCTREHSRCSARAAHADRQDASHPPYRADSHQPEHTPGAER